MQKECQTTENSNVLKAILDSSLDGIMAFKSVYDSKNELVDFIWTLCNQESCKIVNMKEEKLLGQRLSHIMPGNFLPLKSLGGKTLFEHYRSVVLTGKPKVLEFYFEYDGVKEWFENKSVKHEDGFVVTFSVVTQRKEFQLKLEQRIDEEIQKNLKNQKMLFEQSKFAEMGMMLHMIAHQWRQPLNSLSLIFNTMVLKFKKKSLSLQSAFELKQSFQHQIDYMSKTIDDFRSYFKPTGKKNLFNVVDLVQQTQTLIQPVLVKHKVRLSIKGDQMLEYEGYENELKQVVLNLINNAQESLVGSNQKDKKIKIEVKKECNALVLCCEDNGSGIDEAISSHIFEPYFSTKKSKNGTGIGLYMAKTIIEEHFNGTIMVEHLQQGVRFIITLPLKRYKSLES